MHQGCARVCPVGAIRFEPGLDRMLYVDPSECIDCRGCVAECPEGAIVSPDALAEVDRPFAGVNALWFRDREAARAEVEILVPATARSGREPRGPRA
jgi:ferredoxin--NADP+ reductase